MSEKSGQWFKGCALGCGGLVVLCVLMLVGMSVSMRGAFDDAQADREILDAEFGGQDGFTPTVDGSVGEDRVAAFLEVREALTEIHADIEAVDREMGDFEHLADDGEPELRVALPAVARMTRSMMGLPWVFGEIERTRNRALLDAKMGLGEYTYIFIVAYHDQLLDPTIESTLFSASPANSRVRAELRGMIRRQMEAATNQRPDDEDLLTLLTAEVEALETDERRIPWQDGLPAWVAESFAVHRGEIDETFSAAAAEFELLNSTIRGGGMSIEMN